jgi:hypothetical protein
MEDFNCASGLHCEGLLDGENGRCQKCASGFILIGVQCFAIGEKSSID